MLAGMFLLLRRRLRNSAAALFGGLVFALSGFSLLHFVHPNAVAVVAHIPWLLWAIDVACGPATRRQQAAALGAIALLTGSQLLLGYPQYVWFSLLAQVAYTAWRLTGNRAPWRAGGYLVAAELCGLLVGCAQLLPTVDALQNSTRLAVDPAFAGWGSLHPLNLVQLVAPYLFESRVVGQNTHELGLYDGVVPLLLCVWLLTQRAYWGRLRPLVWATIVLGATGLLLACGEYTPLYKLQSWLPLVSHFRFPCRAIVLVHLAMAGGTAAAMAILLRRQQTLRGIGTLLISPSPIQPGDGERTALRAVQAPHPDPLPGVPGRGRGLDDARLVSRAPWIVVGLSVVLAIVGPIVWQPYAAAPLLVWIGPMLMAAAAWLLTLAQRGSRGALVGLVLLAVVDQSAYGLSYSVHRRFSDLNEFVAAAPRVPAETSTRVAGDLARPGERTLRVGNRMLLSGVQRVDGYAGLEPAKQLDYRSAASLRAAGVGLVRRSPTTNRIGGLEPVSAEWLAVPNPLPRARLVQLPPLPPGEGRGEGAPKQDPATLNPLNVEDATDLPGIFRVVHDRPGDIELAVSTPVEQLLMLTESFHEGWLADVDGRAAPVVRVDGDFLGVLVEPGDNVVRLEFRPRSLRTGIILSGCGVGLMLCLCLARCRGAR